MFYASLPGALVCVIACATLGLAAMTMTSHLDQANERDHPNPLLLRRETT